MGSDRMGSDEVIWNGIRSDRMRWDGIGSDEVIWDGIGSDEVMWDGMGSDEVMWNGMGSDHHRVRMIVAKRSLLDLRSFQQQWLCLRVAAKRLGMGMRRDWDGRDGMRRDWEGRDGDETGLGGAGWG